MSYLSILETAKKWGISKRRVQVLCSENRIPGAIRIGNYWAIPEDAATGIHREAPAPVLPDSLNTAMRDVERTTICRTLRENGGNISATARVLKMSRQSLQYRLRKYGIRPDEL